MVIENLGMLLQEGNRAKAYLQKLIKNNLLPNFVFLVQDPDNSKQLLNINTVEINTDYYDPGIKEVDTLKNSGISFQIIKAKSCNDDIVIDKLKKRHENFFIFSGYDILKEILNAGKRIIHVHPGKLPWYRGSTCLYYSILNEKKWGCTAIIMKPGIDQGDIIITKEFPVPPKEMDKTRIYDPHTRSEVLIDVAEQLAKTGTLKTSAQDIDQGNVYYVIHPVLEYIAKNLIGK